MGGGEVEGQRWSVLWPLDDPDERSPPSSFVAQCDTAEVLTLALAAAATKRRRNARLATAALVSVSRRGWKRCKQDGKEKSVMVTRSKPAGKLWRWLSRFHPCCCCCHQHSGFTTSGCFRTESLDEVGSTNLDHSLEKMLREEHTISTPL